MGEMTLNDIASHVNNLLSQWIAASHGDYEYPPIMQFFSKAVPKNVNGVDLIIQQDYKVKTTFTIQGHPDTSHPLYFPEFISLSQDIAVFHSTLKRCNGYSVVRTVTLEQNGEKSLNELVHDAFFAPGASGMSFQEMLTSTLMTDACLHRLGLTEQEVLSMADSIRMRERFTRLSVTKADGKIELFKNHIDTIEDRKRILLQYARRLQQYRQVQGFGRDADLDKAMADYCQEFGEGPN